ncbi:MAG: hypothetical protein A3K18_34080 [Lentisphaerae bacterium RIFOXYA12_64_32]|nr:MAG: hypothetical protein A3K18_34080 [Lentisphaerae bacterium RIFOXYA12_64_32]
MDLFALDFDGVLCDSAAETAVSAWRAGARLWPAWTGAEPPPEFLARFVRQRPVIETGYQTVLLMYLIAESQASDADIERDFVGLCDQAMARHGLPREELLARFGETRDRWMADNLQDWLGRHRFYPGVIEKVTRRLQAGPVFILTTKQERFAAALLAAHGLPFPPERLFGLERGLSKEQGLRDLRGRAEFAHARVHLVEDRLETLLRVQNCPDLVDVRLYLADWGYTTRSALATARANPRLQVCSLNTFLDV